MKCEVGHRQETGWGQPMGYGVRFLELSSRTHEFCQRIVCDAVLQALLYPEEEKRIPTLDQGDPLIIPGYDQL